MLLKPLGVARLAEFHGTKKVSDKHFASSQWDSIWSSESSPAESDARFLHRCVKMGVVVSQRSAEVHYVSIPKT
eukprot:5633467-Amphidinium_carterae.1